MERERRRRKFSAEKERTARLRGERRRRCAEKQGLG
jgi:hypothetical protein